MILSIQSHVAYGYVGNRVATFILQRMGFDVVTVNTVQFSNHTGYGKWSGDILSVDHVRTVLKGLEEVGALKQCTALLSGYLGSPETADVVIEAFHMIKKHNPNVVYLCDPVMGDVGRGLFVKEEIPAKFKQDVIHNAFCVTPNLFELEVLIGKRIHTMDDLKFAMRSLPNPVVVVTSVDLPDLDPKQVYMVMCVRENEGVGRGGDDLSTDEFYTVHALKFAFDTPPNGSGDAVSALFLGHFLRTRDVKDALNHTNKAMHHLFKMTHKQMQRDPKQRELALIHAQSYFT